MYVHVMYTSPSKEPNTYLRPWGGFNPVKEKETKKKNSANFLLGPARKGKTPRSFARPSPLSSIREAPAIRKLRRENRRGACTAFDPFLRSIFRICLHCITYGQGLPVTRGYFPRAPALLAPLPFLGYGGEGGTGVERVCCCCFLYACYMFAIAIRMLRSRLRMWENDTLERNHI